MYRICNVAFTTKKKSSKVQHLGTRPPRYNNIIHGANTFVKTVDLNDLSCLIHAIVIFHWIPLDLPLERAQQK